MNDQDKEAFDRWKNDSGILPSEQLRIFFEMNEQERIKFALEQAWQAACDYKQKEIDKLETDLAKANAEAESWKRHHAALDKVCKVYKEENAKLRECVQFYADTNNWDAADGIHDSIISGVITGADHYEPWEETGIAVGGKHAIECLKELDKK